MTMATHRLAWDEVKVMSHGLFCRYAPCHCMPRQVQDGTYVSSMVEDASFLVHKSLRRSVSTRSEQAIMAVCHRVKEVSTTTVCPAVVAITHLLFFLLSI